MRQAKTSNESIRTATRWDLIAFAAAAIIALGIGIAAIAYGISNQIEYNRDADQHSAEYARLTKYPERNSCYALPVPNQSHCIAKTIDAARNYERNEQDLVAQKTSAIWAFLMGTAAIIGMILSAAGVFLVWTTFRATKDANDIAKAIGRAQVRAYLSCKSARFFTSKDSVTATLEITNIGQSPSHGVTICGTVNIQCIGGSTLRPRVLTGVGSENVIVNCQPINSTGTTFEDIHFFWPISFLVKNDKDMETRHGIFKGGNSISFDLKIVWFDVFYDRHEIAVYLSSPIGPGPKSPLKKRARTGSLDLKLDDLKRGFEYGQAEDK